MAIEKKSKSLSKATKTLLSGGETEYVDFKRTPDGVHADDLVSFANSDHGGEILVGIAEETGKKARSVASLSGATSAMVRFCKSSTRQLAASLR